MKILINENHRILMIQKVIDDSVDEIRNWCEEEEEEDFDFDTADLCESLESLTKVEVKTLHENTIGIIIYVESGDDYTDMGPIFHELGVVLKNTIGDSFNLKLLNVVEE